MKIPAPSRYPSHGLRRQELLHMKMLKLHRMASQCSGFTLVELLTVIAIIFILSTLAIPMMDNYRTKTKNSRAMNELRMLGAEISGYILDKQAMPADLGAINRAGFRDPWGNPYEFSAPPALEDPFFAKLNTDYDLYSKGKDGQSAAAFSDSKSKDDIVRFNDGSFVGVRSP